jgi:hypothetical protein
MNRDCTLLAIAAIGVAFPRDAQAAPTFGLYGSGVDGSGIPVAGNSVDSHYLLNGGQAIVVSRPDGSWLASGSTSAWIAPQGDESDDGDTNGAHASLCSGGALSVCLASEYTYTTTFDLTGYDLSTVSISGQWATDNAGLGIYLNGTRVSTFATPDASFDWHPFSFASGTVSFASGVNTLGFVVHNDYQANPFAAYTATGLRVQIAGTGQQPAGTIQGTVYSDLDGNGHRGGSFEGGISGWHVFMDDPVLQVTRVVSSASDGTYAFSSLFAGAQYRVYAETRSNPVQSQPGPPGDYKVTLNPGASAAGVDFGEAPGPAPVHAPAASPAQVVLLGTFLLGAGVVLGGRASRRRRSR